MSIFNDDSYIPPPLEIPPPAPAAESPTQVCLACGSRWRISELINGVCGDACCQGTVRPLTEPSGACQLVHTLHEPKDLDCPNPACGKGLTVEWTEGIEDGPHLATCPCCNKEITFAAETEVKIILEPNLYSTEETFPK